MSTVSLRFAFSLRGDSSQATQDFLVFDRGACAC